MHVKEGQHQMCGNDQGLWDTIGKNAMAYSHINLSKIWMEKSFILH